MLSPRDIEIIHAERMRDLEAEIRTARLLAQRPRRQSPWRQAFARMLVTLWAGLGSTVKWLAPGAKARSAIVLADGAIAEWTMDAGEGVSQTALAEPVVVIHVKTRPKVTMPHARSNTKSRFAGSVDELMQPELAGVWVALSLIVVLLGAAVVTG